MSGGDHAYGAQCGDHRRGREQGTQSGAAMVDEVGDQVALHRGHRNQQRRPGQRDGEDDHTPAAPSSPEVASRTGKPITRIALAPAAAMECAAPRNSGTVPGVRNRATDRAVTEPASTRSHATAPPTVAHKEPDQAPAEQRRRRRPPPPG